MCYAVLKQMRNVDALCMQIFTCLAEQHNASIASVHVSMLPNNCLFFSLTQRKKSMLSHLSIKNMQNTQNMANANLAKYYVKCFGYSMSRLRTSMIPIVQTGYSPLNIFHLYL